MADTRDTAPLTYADAGVSIAAGNALVKMIAPLARATARPGADAELGGFGGFFDPRAAGYTDPLLVAANDGVGTKLKLAIATGKHGTVGIDLVAMCVNDLIVQGAEPLFFLDYFASAALDTGVAAAVVAGIADGCRIANCALIGGETAEMPGMYAPGDYDLAGFSVGAVERGQQLTGDRVRGRRCPARPRLVGGAFERLLADPPHRRAQRRAARPPRPVRHRAAARRRAARTDADLRPLAAAVAQGREHQRPRPYHRRRAAREHPAHPARRVPRARRCRVWPLPPLFAWLQAQGRIEPGELARTFNCGIGMVLAVAADRAADLTQVLNDAGETVHRIGRIEAGERGCTVAGADEVWSGRGAWAATHHA